MKIQKTREKIWHRLAPLAGFVVLGALISRVSAQSILSSLSCLAPKNLLVLPFALMALFIAQTLKWGLLLRHQHVGVPFMVLFRLNLVGLFWGAVTPGRAGVILKAGYLAGYCRRPVSQVSSSVIVDKLLELVVLGCFATVGLAVVATNFGIRIFLCVASITVMLLALLFAFSRVAVARYVTKALSSLLVPKARRQTVEEHVDLFYAGMPCRTSLLVPLLLTICCWLLIWTQTFIVAGALSISISYSLFIVIAAIGGLISLIPITVNGIGTRDAALVALLSVYGVAPQRRWPCLCSPWFSAGTSRRFLVRRRLSFSKS